MEINDPMAPDALRAPSGDPERPAPRWQKTFDKDADPVHDPLARCVCIVTTSFLASWTA
jgi:hypothetical protein